MADAAMVDATSAGDLLAVENLSVHFHLRMRAFETRVLKAVADVSLTVKPGECLGLVGESGCGKSTLALAIMGLVRPTGGRIRLAGHEIGPGGSADRATLARSVQMVFQDPYASLNPRQTVRRTLADPLRIHGVDDAAEVEARVADMLAKVGLRPEHADRYPHEFSGGQRQRIGIARALILKPRLVICDEPVSALDVSIRAQIINLLLDLKDEFGLSYIMISHDLGVVEHMSDRVAVMYLGRLVETADWRQIFENARHPYTRALIAAIPEIGADPSLQQAKAKGEIPSALNPPPGCAFSTRCPRVTDRCRVDPMPELDPIDPGHAVRCWLAREPQPA